MHSVHNGFLLAGLARLQCLLDFALAQVELPGVLVFADEVRDEDVRLRTVSHYLVLLQIQVDSLKDPVLFEVLAEHDFETHFAHYGHIGVVNKRNMEGSANKGQRVLAFDGLVALLPQVLNRLELLLLDNDRLGNLLVTVCKDVHRILSKEKGAFVHPAKAGDHVVLLEQEQFLSIAWLRFVVGSPYLFVLGRGLGADCD